MKKAYEQILERIRAACKDVDRDPLKIKLLAVSKFHSAQKINEYLSISKEALIAENYVQEFEKKKPLINLPYEAHLIGHLQSNKVALAVSLFDVIQTVDTEKLANLIDKAASNLKKTQRVYLQINISSDKAKSGASLEEAAKLVQTVLTFRNIKLEGLMTITKAYDFPEQALADYEKLRNFALKLTSDYPQLSANGLELSMGMTADLEVAVRAGSTMVRVGTGIFGERS